MARLTEELAGRTALVTGGATGIGFAAAALLLERGAAVALTGHREDQVAAAREALAAHADRLLAMPADVRDLAALEAAVRAAEARFERLDLLVSAAGIQIPGTVLTAAEDDWQRVIDVNLSGAFRACKAAVPAMLRAGGGAIVIVSSIQALLGKRNGVAYVAAKGGLNAMTRALALDHAEAGIRVNAVCPGVVDTPMLREAARRLPGDEDQTVAAWARAQPLGVHHARPCRPEDVAELILFLLGPGAAHVTGSEFRIDDGLGAKLAL
ncbi:MAG: SDR family oxidoreductase [Alphaproteobacteria bacterium]|nr:SDR family oxidoreductase [Alphaproteobacteria bacterium]